MQRELVFLRYQKLLEKLKNVQLPSKRSYVDPMWHLFPIQVNASDRRAVYDLLRKSGIGVQVNYMPANWHPIFANQGGRSATVDVAVNFYQKQLSLPMHSDLSEVDQEFISNTLIEILTSLKK